MYGPTHWTIIEIIKTFLQNEIDERKKWQLIKDIINTCKGIFIPVQIIVKLENEMNKNTEYFIRESDIKYLQQVCIKKIKQPSKLEYFITYPKKLGIILESWRKWTNSIDVEKKVEELVSSKDGLLSFIETFLKSNALSNIENGLVLRKQYRMNISEIEKYISIDILVTNMEKQAISTEKLEGNKKVAVDIFNIALDRRQEGKPDDDLWDDE